MRKRIIGCSIAMAVVLVVLPIAYLFAPADAGMMLLMLSFLVLNPVLAMVLGSCISPCFRELWYFPAVTGLVYLATVCCIFGPNGAFVMYALFYMTLGYAAAGVRKLFEKR